MFCSIHPLPLFIPLTRTHLNGSREATSADSSRVWMKIICWTVSVCIKRLLPTYTPCYLVHIHTCLSLFWFVVLCSFSTKSFSISVSNNPCLTFLHISFVSAFLILFLSSISLIPLFPQFRLTNFLSPCLLVCLVWLSASRSVHLSVFSLSLILLSACLLSSSDCFFYFYPVVCEPALAVTQCL